MISIKYASIIAVAAFAAGAFFASPVPSAIAAVIATDVQCTGCVGTSDLGGNAVTAAKIKDGEVKAAEIATGAVGVSEIAANSVGASELIGVTKMLFSSCATSYNNSLSPGSGVILNCDLSGVDSDDHVIVQIESITGGSCFTITEAEPAADSISITVRNTCSLSVSIGNIDFSIIVYDT